MHLEALGTLRLLISGNCIQRKSNRLQILMVQRTAPSNSMCQAMPPMQQQIQYLVNNQMRETTSPPTSLTLCLSVLRKLPSDVGRISPCMPAAAVRATIQQAEPPQPAAKQACLPQPRMRYHGQHVPLCWTAAAAVYSSVQGSSTQSAPSCSSTNCCVANCQRLSMQMRVTKPVFSSCRHNVLSR